MLVGFILGVITTIAAIGGLIAWQIWAANRGGGIGR